MKTNMQTKAIYMTVGKKIVMNLAIILTLFIAGSATSQKTSFYWLVYDGSGSQKDLANYQIIYWTPNHEFVPLSFPNCNWFRVEDVDEDGIISYPEFDFYFELYDRVNTLSDALSDEPSDIYGQLDLKNRP